MVPALDLYTMEARGSWLRSSGSEIVLEMRSLPKVVVAGLQVGR